MVDQNPNIMRFTFVFAALFLPLLLSAQEVPEGMAEYNPDFKFRDGLFLSFEQVKNNDPIPKAKILIAVDYNDREFFKKLMEKEVMYYYNDLGQRQSIARDDLWGYARNGVLYIQVQGDFHRVTYMGSITHFVADITTYEQRYYDPYYYSPYSAANRYYYNPYSYYSPYSTPYSRAQYSKNEMKQYVLNFETGKFMEFDYKSVEVLLMPDLELYEEYMKLSRRKKKQLKFLYIRKYNEKHPVYLPTRTR